MWPRLPFAPQIMGMGEGRGRSEGSGREEREGWKNRRSEEENNDRDSRLMFES